MMMWIFWVVTGISLLSEGLKDARTNAIVALLTGGDGIGSCDQKTGHVMSIVIETIHLLLDQYGLDITVDNFKDHRCFERKTWRPEFLLMHCGDVITRALASQITSLTVVYSTVYSDVDQRKHQSSASLAIVRGIHRWPVNSSHKCQLRGNVSIWWRHHGQPLFLRWWSDIKQMSRNCESQV